MSTLQEQSIPREVYWVIWAGWIGAASVNWLLGFFLLLSTATARFYFPSAEPDIMTWSDALVIMFWIPPCGGQAALLYYLRRSRDVVWWGVSGTIGWAAFWILYNIVSIVSGPVWPVVLGGLVIVALLQGGALWVMLRPGWRMLAAWLLFHMVFGLSHSAFPASALPFWVWGGLYGLGSGAFVLRARVSPPAGDTDA
ncbi:MAG: hypothetical protein MI924_00085 [Chloroflexales bacterium]|nr:hypothetical protein [Chloroflexales bacterium]